MLKKSRIPYRDLKRGPVDLRGSDVSILPEVQRFVAGVPGLHTSTSMEDILINLLSI